MGGKKPFVFPSLLFAIFFLLITITGYFQIRVIQGSIEGLLKSEGEIFFKHIKREIDTNLEYLSLLEQSPSIITPNFLNIMVYDEAIVDDLYNLLSTASTVDIDKLPLSKVVVMDRNGKVIARKGTVRVTPEQVRKLFTGREGSFIKMPGPDDRSLLMGIRIKDQAIFFSLDDTELDVLRTKFIIREIIDREDKRFNITGIRIFDEKGSPYIASNGKEGDVFVLSKPLDSKFLPGYRMDILISKELASRTFRGTTLSFIFILTLLGLSGALGISAIFLLQRRHEENMKEMEKSIAVKERLVSLGKLASGMAHEIRNPLNAISLSVQRLKREFVPGDEKKEEYFSFVEIIRSELLRVNHIVEEFLLSTKAQVPYLKENVYGIIEEVMIILREKAEDKGIRLVNKVDRSLAVPAQKERLKQAFHNIILNGIEAVTGKGAIEVSAVVRHDSVDLSIKDSGPGIEKEKLHTIFEYYYTTKDKGMGLGLPISYMIVKDHGGDIGVTSEEGRGTTFVVTLPKERKETGNA
jgi:signal transduction histidine kinase